MGSSLAHRYHWPSGQAPHTSSTPRPECESTHDRNQSRPDSRDQHCFAVKRWPDPADWIEIVTALGLDSVQLSLDLLPVAFDRKPALAYARRAAKLADAAGVRIHSLFTGLAAYSSGLLLSDDTEDRLAAFRWYQDIIEITAEAGARGVGGHIGALSVRAASSQAMTQRLVDEELSMMRDLADTAQRAGLDHLQFENLAVIENTGTRSQRLTRSKTPWSIARCHGDCA